MIMTQSLEIQKTNFTENSYNFIFQEKCEFYRYKFFSIIYLR